MLHTKFAFKGCTPWTFIPDLYPPKRKKIKPNHQPTPHPHPLPIPPPQKKTQEGGGILKKKEVFHIKNEFHNFISHNFIIVNYKCMDVIRLYNENIHDNLYIRILEYSG